MSERATRLWRTSPTIATCEALQMPEGVPHREEVEERLRRVLALAVAGVDDRRAGVACGELRRSDLRVADDDRVRVVRRQRQDACP